MYMRVLPDEVKFEWDEGNEKKIYEKHGITAAEVEEIFLDKDLIILPGIGHSQGETRYIAVGKGSDKRAMHVVFTMRGDRIRAISARRMHRKEGRKYEEIKKDTTF